MQQLQEISAKRKAKRLVEREAVPQFDLFSRTVIF
jgi:hypothetical protein